MKVFLAALALMAAIAIGADLGLDKLCFSSAETYTQSNRPRGGCYGRAAGVRCGV